MSDHSDTIQDPVKQQDTNNNEVPEALPNKYEGTDAPVMGTVRHPLPPPTAHIVPRSAWSTELCHCCDHGAAPCIEATICANCVMAEMYNKLYHDRTNEIHWPFCGCLVLTGLVSSLGQMGGTSILANTFLFTMRRDLRRRYNIRLVGDDDAMEEPEVLGWCGEFGSDMCLSIFCPQCLLCQMQREMAVRGDYAGYVLFASEKQQELSAAAAAASQPTIQQIV